MKRLFSALVLVTLSVAACGGDDDDDDNGGNAGTSGSSTAGTSSSNGGEPPSSSGGAPPTGNVMCDADADTTCQNPTDCPFVENGQARITSGECGRMCLLTGNMDPACPVDCILGEIEMTADCADCYSAATLCGIENCADECLEDPEAEVCQTCLVDAGCRSDFNDCSGLEQ
jgi:hypothetical protein